VTTRVTFAAAHSRLDRENEALVHRCTSCTGRARLIHKEITVSSQRILLSLAAVTAFTSAADATPISGPRSVGSFFSNDDGASHAIIAKTNGDVLEAFWWDNTGVGSSVIAHFDNIAAVSGFYSSWDGYRHAIVGLHNGQIWDVHFNPCCGITPTLLTTLSGWGDLKSLSAWTDPQHHTNIAFLTRWGTSTAFALYQQGGGSPTTTTFVDFFANDSGIDVAGHHEIWNNTSMVTVAVGSPSRLAQISWGDNQRPDQFVDINAGSNIPWATRFPANQTAQTIVSLTASDAFCYFCQQWGGVEQIDLVTTANQMKTFNVNNGGGTLFDDWNFTYGPQVRSITGPFASPVSGGSYRRNTLVMMSNGDLWDMNPLWSSSAPQWTFRKIGTF
jgi:hypothetical protein